MAHYVLAQWDYTAEGNFELSFREGDKIKLLEKHNDDWWEGELNDEIGFFPANRTKVYSEDQQVIGNVSRAITAAATAGAGAGAVPNHATGEYSAPTFLERSIVSSSNPYLQTSTAIGNDRETVSALAIPRVQDENILIDISTESHSQEQSLFFNESSSEPQWEKPAMDDPSSSTQIVPSAPPLPTTPPNLIKKPEDMVYDIQKLNLEALHPSWIRIQSSIQIKVATCTTGETELSWKDYYGVLTNGFLLVYKEGLHKLGRRPSSIKPVPAYFTIDLKSSEIIPATKTDTRKKHAFIIHLDNYRVFVNIPTESLYAEWLDAIMREMIHVKENTEQQDVNLIELLASIPLDSKLESTSTNTTTTASLGAGTTTTTTEDANPAEDAKSVSIDLKRQVIANIPPQAIHRMMWVTDDFHLAATAVGNDVFGGSLKLEQDGQIPFVVRHCIDQVEQRGLDVVGIYRLSGQSTSIQKYKALFNSKPEQVNLAQEHDINVITGLLKLYFRELKSPLLTFEYYDRFIEAARLQDYDERMFRLKSIIQVLPVVNYKVLHFLVRHLERVKNNSHINKMEASNLALIFSIGLLRSKHDDVSASILHTDLASKIVETIISHVDWFFDTDTTEEEEEEEE
ncbi:hypothetical protein HMPREF1544_03709 [Mucor circinelloides 1006PhL]|uniref:RhoGAP-domain-containing protein n=1 Tax=Mucor circinelloides f. circinelloides (strain 1006PhL) TaxID=1220926 RepID=S2K2M0_MUCC1|nr:hypothetical protein HMPREF1544_03709 [Mucor circinelloides 1006PhL]